VTCLTLHIASLPALPAPLKLRHYGTLQMFYNSNYYFLNPGQVPGVQKKLAN